MEIMEWWWRFGDGMKLSPVLGRAWRLCNGGGGSQMGMVLEVRRWNGIFLHVRCGRFAAEAAA